MQIKRSEGKARLAGQVAPPALGAGGDDRALVIEAAGHAAKIDRHVGDRLRAARRIRGISQGQLAAWLDLTPQQVQKYEGGLNRISASRLMAVAQLLGTTVGFFFDGLPSGPGLWPWLLSDESIGVGDDETLLHRENQDIVAAFERIEAPETRRRILAIVANIAALYAPGAMDDGATSEGAPLLSQAGSNTSAGW